MRASSTARLITVCACAAVFVGTGLQAQVAPSNPRITVVGFGTGDWMRNELAARAVRASLDSLGGTRSLTLVPSDEVELALRAAGFRELWREDDLRLLARYFRTDVAVAVTVQTTATGVRLEPTILYAQDLRRTTLSATDGSDLSTASAALARKIAADTTILRRPRSASGSR